MLVTNAFGPIPTHEIYDDGTPTNKSVQHRPKSEHLSGSLGDLSILQWHTNAPVGYNYRAVSPAGCSQRTGHRKNHVRENIRRLRLYPRLGLQKPFPDMASRVTMGCSKQQPGKPIPRPATAAPRCMSHTPPEQTMDVKRYIGDHVKSNVLPFRIPNQDIDNQPPKHDRAVDTSQELDTRAQTRSITPKKSRTIRQSIPAPLVSKGVQANPLETTWIPSDQQSQPLTSRNHKPLDPRTDRARSADPRKHEFLRAHANTAAGDWNLRMLGTMPIGRISCTPRPEQLTVPKATTAKSVQLIRRNINFVRANAHLAVLTKSNVPKSVINSSECANSMQYPVPPKSPPQPSTTTGLLAVVNQGMWPERRLPVGGIPYYLVKLRRKAAKARERELANRPDPDQPPGHVLMPNQERLDTLELLRKVHKELNEQWSRLPVRVDTVRLRSHKTDLEQKLDELERAISIFDKPKVYVKQD